MGHLPAVRQCADLAALVSYVLDDQYTNLINGAGEKRKLLAFAHLKPSLLDGFASATIMGACFKNSVLYQLWSAAGVEFRPHKAITKRLRYTTHANGHLLTILYATEEDWSKNFRDKADRHDGATIGDCVIQRVAETFATMTSCGWATRTRRTTSSADAATGCRTHRTA